MVDKEEDKVNKVLKQIRAKVFKQWRRTWVEKISILSGGSFRDYNLH